MNRGNESKPHIGLYGACNSGKSTLLNLLAGREVSLVSSVSGTTTDPVRHTMELPGFAPVVVIDTAGIDDRTSLGPLRVKKSYETLWWVDLALVVFTHEGWSSDYDFLMSRIRTSGLPYLLLYNRFPDAPALDATLSSSLMSRYGVPVLTFSATEGADSIWEQVRTSLPAYSYTLPRLFEGQVSSGDHVLMVCPIDGGAPSGRLILPQVQSLRALLDAHVFVTVLQPEELASFFSSFPLPRLVVTDSQVIDRVRPLVPPGVSLTTFSIELARAKGDMEAYRNGLLRVDSLEDGNRILVLESCNHLSGCEDIGRVKIPRWLQSYTGKQFSFTFVSGLSPLPEDLSSYSLAIQCGGCMVTRRQLLMRLRGLKQAGVPVVNYGMLITKIR